MLFGGYLDHPTFGLFQYVKTWTTYIFNCNYLIRQWQLAAADEVGEAELGDLGHEAGEGGGVVERWARSALVAAGMRRRFWRWRLKQIRRQWQVWKSSTSGGGSEAMASSSLRWMAGPTVYWNGAERGCPVVVKTRRRRWRWDPSSSCPRDSPPCPAPELCRCKMDGHVPELHLSTTSPLPPPTVAAIVSPPGEREKRDGRGRGQKWHFTGWMRRRWREIVWEWHGSNFHKF